jgi:hypothetical protein
MGKVMRATVAVLATAIMLAAAATAFGAGSSKGRKDTGTVYLATTHQGNGFIWAAGNTFDKILGKGAVSYKVKVRPASAGTFAVTIKHAKLFGTKGSMTGKVTATQTIAANGSATITNGKFSFAHGTEGLKGHTYKGTVSGTGNALTGQYTLHTKGIFK